MAAIALIAGMATPVLDAGQDAGATPTGLVAHVAPTVVGYRLGLSGPQAIKAPALLVIASPGVVFTTTSAHITVTCSYGCTTAPTPSASVWGIGGTTTQSGASAIVLNLYANDAAHNYAGTFAAYATLELTIPVLKRPGRGSVPMTVAIESSPGVVQETGQTVSSTSGSSSVISARVKSMPNTKAYPHAPWSASLSNLALAPGGTDGLSLYLPGTTFPTAPGSYSLSTCQLTESGTSVVTAACTGITAAPSPETSGLTGTADVVQVHAGAAAPPAMTNLTGLTLEIAGVANPTGYAAGGQPEVGEGAGTFTTLIGAGVSPTVTLLTSPSIGFFSTRNPIFPSSVVAGGTATFGVALTNTTDWSWPANGATVGFSLSGPPGLVPSDVGLQCSYEGVAPANEPSTWTFTFTASGNGLVSNQVQVPLGSVAPHRADCALSTAAAIPHGVLKVAATLTDTTTSPPFVLSTAASDLMVTPPPTTGYTLAGSDGGIFSFGDAQFYGSMGGKPLNQPIVGLAATPDGKGYWEVASDGGIFSFGDAQFYGSMGGQPLNKPIVGLAATPDGKGYWEVASDGGIFSFGDAQFYGSMGGQPLNKPIVGLAATPDGKGYWEVASDGGIFSFGDATFEGSAGALSLNKPVVGMLATSDGDGYWLVASDGGIFTYGDAQFYGSAGALALVKPVVGIS